MPGAALLAALALVFVGGCGEVVRPTDTEPRIEAYPSFFQTLRGENVYLFADLNAKQQFEVDPTALPFAQFIDRTGQRVFISAVDPLLVPRIKVGYEEAVDTELTPANVGRAPPPNTPPPDIAGRDLVNPDAPSLPPAELQE